MLNVNRAMIERGPAQSEEASMVDLGQITAMIKRRWKMIVAIALAFLVLGICYLLVATPQYMAGNEIIIDTQTSQAMQKQDLNDATAVDTSLVDSQVEIIDSDSTALAVVQKLKLDKDPEFVGPASGFIGKLTGAIGDGIGRVMGLLGPKADEPDSSVRRAVDAFKGKLTVKRSGLTYVIGINFWSENRDKAAKIANAVADAYIGNVLDARFAATRRTSDWLEDRLQQIRRQASDADRALQMYKANHNIVDTNRGLMNEQQLAELSTSLANAKAATDEAKARLDRAREVGQDPLGAGTISDALNSQVITRLRAQYLDLNNKASDLAARYGQTHRSVTDLRAQMAQIKASVNDELNRIAAADDSDLKIAKARQDSLQSSMDQMVSQNDSTSLDKVKLEDLASTADSYRALYNGYLQRFQEATQRESFPIADARVITNATPPLHKGSPKSILVLAGALGLGLFFGAGAAFARELVDSFVTPQDVESQTGLPCLGVLPVIASASTKGAKRPGLKGVALPRPIRQTRSCSTRLSPAIPRRSATSRFRSMRCRATKPLR